MRPHTDDRTATDPHGFPRIGPGTGPGIPLPRRRHARDTEDRADAGDTAFVPDPRHPAGYVEDGYDDDRFAGAHADDADRWDRWDADEWDARAPLSGDHPDAAYARHRFDDPRYDAPRYDAQYDQPHVAQYDQRYDAEFDEPHPDGPHAGPPYVDPHAERYTDEGYQDAFYVDDPYTRHGGDTYARSAAVEHTAGRRARGRAAGAREPRERRRPRPPRPPRDDTFVGQPDALAPDDGVGLRFLTVAIPVAIGSLVSVGLGVWARMSDASGVAVNIVGFSSAGAVKTWLATLALLFALVQLWTAMAMRGRVGSGPGPRTALVHRWSGRIAVLVTVPVAVQCLIAMGWSGATPRTLVHSVLGCVFYGAFVTKMLLLRRRGVPGWLLAVSGGLLLAVLAGIWLTSALWFFGTKGLTF